MEYYGGDYCLFTHLDKISVFGVSDGGLAGRIINFGILDFWKKSDLVLGRVISRKISRAQSSVLNLIETKHPHIEKFRPHTSIILYYVLKISYLVYNGFEQKFYITFFLANFSKIL